jgi:outer membrane protein, heavy metal efflux system
MLQEVIGISQQLPLWEKRTIRQEVAQYEVESYNWTIEERKLKLTLMVKETWFQIYTVYKALAIREKKIRIIANFVTITESK